MQSKSHLDFSCDAADFKTKSDRIMEDLQVLSSELLNRIEDLILFKQKSYDLGQDGAQLRTFQENGLASVGKFNLYFTEQAIHLSGLETCSKNYLASAGEDGYTEVHDVENKQQIKRFQAHDCEIMILRYIDTEETEILLSAAADGGIHVWDIKKEFEKLSTFTIHKEAVVALEYLPDLKLVVSGGEDQFLRMWKIQAQKEDYQIKIKGKRLTCICLLKRSKKMAVGNSEGWIFGYDVSHKPPKICFAVEGHSSENSEIMILTAFEDEDNFVSGGRDGTINVWRVNNKGMHCLHTMMEEHVMVRSIRIFEKRDLLISNHLDSKLRFWKLSTGNFLGKLSDKTFGEALVPLRDPNIFVTALHAEVNVWELEEDFDN